MPKRKNTTVRLSEQAREYVAKLSEIHRVRPSEVIRTILSVGARHSYEVIAELEAIRRSKES